MIVHSTQWVSAWPIIVVVVDNASSDRSLEMVKEKFPQTQIFQNPNNLGGAGGFARGLKEAQKAGTDYIWLLDNDAYPDADVLEKSIGHLEQNRNVGALGSLIRMESSPRSVQECGGRLDLIFGGIQQVGLGSPIDDFKGRAPFEVDFCAACSLFVRVEAVLSAGSIDPDLFFYLDDIEWCSRIREAGWKIEVLPGAQVSHEFVQDKPLSPFRWYFSRRNYFTLFLDRMPKSVFWVTRLFALILKFVFETLSLLLSGRTDLLRAHFAAFFTYLNNYRGGLACFDPIPLVTVPAQPPADFSSLLLVGFFSSEEILDLFKKNPAFTKVARLDIQKFRGDFDLAPIRIICPNTCVSFIQIAPSVFLGGLQALRLFFRRWDLAVIGFQRADPISFLARQRRYYDGNLFYRLSKYLKLKAALAALIFVWIMPALFIVLSIKSLCFPNRYRKPI